MRMDTCHRCSHALAHTEKISLSSKTCGLLLVLVMAGRGEGQQQPPRALKGLSQPPEKPCPESGVIPANIVYKAKITARSRSSILTEQIRKKLHNVCCPFP